MISVVDGPAAPTRGGSPAREVSGDTSRTSTSRQKSSVLCVVKHLGARTSTIFICDTLTVTLRSDKDEGSCLANL